MFLPQKLFLLLFTSLFDTRTDVAEKTGKKPDWKIGTRFKRKDYFFFFVEVKRLGVGSSYQAEDDLVKLMKLMKDSINEQIDLGFTAPVSFSLLVEGKL